MKKLWMKGTAALIAWLYVITGIAQSNTDTIPLTKPDSFYVDHSDRLVIGAAFNQYNFNYTFKNISANLVGDLYNDYSDDDFPVTVNKWIFSPSVNRNYVSAFVACRYGSYSFSRSMDQSANIQTDVKSIAFSIPYKSLSISFDYLKYTGMYRKGPLNEQLEFLPGMIVRPMSITLEYSGKGNKIIRDFNSLRNPLLNTPKKSVGAFSFLLGYSDLLIQSDSDFIPGLAYADSTQNPYTIQEVKNTYLNRFTSQGGRIGMRASYFFKLFSRNKPEKFQSFYIHLWTLLMYNVQKYHFYSMTGNFDNLQFNKYQSGFGPTTNLYGTVHLVWDADTWLVSAGVNYYNMLYGSGTDNYYDGNAVREVKFNFNVRAAYRLPFAGMIHKVNRVVEK